jgi:hypothetical protein
MGSAKAAFSQPAHQRVTQTVGRHLNWSERLKPLSRKGWHVAWLKGAILSTEFQKYGFSDFLRASALAPLASIPAVLLVDLFILFADIILPNPLESLAIFGRLALFLIYLSLPISYFSTAIFGALGIGIANSARVHLTVPIGALAGVVCGAITGLLCLLFMAGGTLHPSLLSEGRWLYILVGTICGLFVGVAYPKLLNRSVQHNSTNRNVTP